LGFPSNTLKLNKGLTSLTHLNLSDTNVTDAGKEHLKGLSSLTNLDLSLTQITDAGLAELKAALPKLGVIKQ
jgi:internalin A